MQDWTQKKKESLLEEEQYAIEAAAANKRKTHGDEALSLCKLN